MDDVIRVVVVDDHKMIAKAIMDMVNGFSHCQVLYTVHDGTALLQQFSEAKNIPDLVLLDISMAGMDGFETMERLHRDHPEVRVLCLSMRNEETVFLRMVELGVHGFVPKIAGGDELERAIRSVMEKGFYFTPRYGRGPIPRATCQFRRACRPFGPRERAIDICRNRNDLCADRR
jgi:DNA-binding NarL/FixJ family response regulator